MNKREGEKERKREILKRERERGKTSSDLSGAGELSCNANVKKFINTTPRCHCELSVAEEKRYERALVLQSGTSHKSHFTRYILNSVPPPGKTRLKIVARFYGTFGIIQRIFLENTIRARFCVAYHSM